MIPHLLLEKLCSVETRYEELNQQLALPEVVSDSKRYQKIAKTHSDLGEIVQKFREYKEVQRGIDDTRSMLHEANGNADIKKMAKDELTLLEDQVAKCETELKFLLLPKDPNDERNVILEIRAGTGGDEAALFRSEEH